MVTKPSSTPTRHSGGPEERPAYAGKSDGDERRYDVSERNRGGAAGRGGAERGSTAGTRDQSDDPGRGLADRLDRRHRIRTTLDLIRANPTGRIALRVFVAITGAIVVAIGVALIPLPGPGWLMVIGGIGIWAIEFHWARRLLAFTRRNVQAWTRWVGRQSWPVRILLGAVGLVFVSVVVWLSLKYGLGIDVAADLLRYLATH
jgi:uncharacterized protein (TIGR02611 family)